MNTQQAVDAGQPSDVDTVLRTVVQHALETVAFADVAVTDAPFEWDAEDVRWARI